MYGKIKALKMMCSIKTGDMLFWKVHNMKSPGKMKATNKTKVEDVMKADVIMKVDDIMKVVSTMKAVGTMKAAKIRCTSKKLLISIIMQKISNKDNTCNKIKTSHKKKCVGKKMTKQIDIIEGKNVVIEISTSKTASARQQAKNANKIQTTLQRVYLNQR